MRVTATRANAIRKHTAHAVRESRDVRFFTVTAPVLRSARLVSAYRRYLSSSDTPRFSVEVGQYYSTSTLVRLLSMGGVEMRRAAALALGVLGDSEAVEPLGRRLSDADRGVRLASDDAFRGLLVRNAAPTHHHKLLQVMHLNDGGEFAAALPPALILVDQAPDYSEAHHQLALCWMGLGELGSAEDAFRACLWRCRYHYAAWVGLAHCRLQQHQPSDDDLMLGLKALSRALAICPDLEGARIELRRVEKSLESNWIDFDMFHGQDAGDDDYPCESEFHDDLLWGDSDPFEEDGEGDLDSDLGGDFWS